MKTKHLVKPTLMAKMIIKDNIQKGETVIDATMGNGHDTLFLAQMVGENGKVIAFDVQKEAIENTKELLEKNNIHKNVVLIHDGHEHMDQYIDESIGAVMFNLGYLPKGNHEITTTAKTTLEALKKALNCLKIGGILCMVLYYGHEQGLTEKDGVLEYIQDLDCKKFHVFKVDYLNQKKAPPILVGIIKK